MTVLFLILFDSSCTYKQVNLKTHTSFLIGTWELSLTRGGNILPTIFRHGNGNLLKFTGVTFQLYAEGKLLSQGTYSITNNEVDNFIINYNNTTNSDIAIFEKDKLKLIPSHPDLATRVYIRVR